MNALLEVIPLERIEREADYVREELERLLDVARDHYRAIQDLEVEVEAGGDPGPLWARLVVARGELAGIARQMTRAGALLIHHTDHRFNVGRQVAGHLDEADRKSGFPRAVA